MNPALALQEAMRGALLGHGPLVALLGGAHVYDEPPRGVNASYVSFGECETRDWSVFDHKAHEHLVSLRVRTNARSQRLAQQIVSEIEAALDGAALALTGHALVNLRVAFWAVRPDRNSEHFGALVRLRAATEEA